MVSEDLIQATLDRIDRAFDQASKDREADRSRWDAIISTVNNGFAVHNTKIDESCKATREAIAESAETRKTYQDVAEKAQAYDRKRMWDMLTYVVIILGVLAGGAAVLKFFGIG